MFRPVPLGTIVTFIGRVERVLPFTRSCCRAAEPAVEPAGVAGTVPAADCGSAPHEGCPTTSLVGAPSLAVASAVLMVLARPLFSVGRECVGPRGPSYFPFSGVALRIGVILFFVVKFKYWFSYLRGYLWRNKETRAEALDSDLRLWATQEHIRSHELQRDIASVTVIYFAVYVNHVPVHGSSTFPGIPAIGAGKIPREQEINIFPFTL